MFNVSNKTTLRDLGYNAAATGDTLKTIADELLRRYPQGLSDEATAELKDGMVGRKAELVGEQRYLVEDKTYTKIGKNDKVKDGAVTFTLTVEYAMSLSAYEFGKLKTDNPNLYKIVGATRTDTNKYVSNRMASLAKFMTGETRSPRAANKSFADWVVGDKGVVDTVLARLATAIKNKDDTAPRSKAELIDMITKKINKAK